jgi:hypothetical protein
LTGFRGSGRLRLIGERRCLRSLQQAAQVYFNVARIAAEGFFCGSLAETARLKIVEELFLKVGDEALQPPADRCFVNVENARNLQQGLAIEKVRGEQEAIFWRKSLQGSLDGATKLCKFCRHRRSGRCGCRNVEGVERSLAVNTTMVIDVALRESGTEPAKK